MTTEARRIRVLRILIVDDHPLVREGLARVLVTQPDLCVWGEAASVAEAWQRLEAGLPDVAVVDLSLPGTSGMVLIKELQARHPEVPVLVLSMHEEVYYAERALRAGARGYLMKHEPADRIIEALRTLARGDVYLSPRIAGDVMNGILKGRGRSRRAGGHSPIDRLSDRELQVLELIGQGYGTARIAAHLTLSAKTIETYRAHLRQKLGLPTGSDLVHYAVRWYEDERSGGAAAVAGARSAAGPHAPGVMGVCSVSDRQPCVSSADGLA